MSPAEAEVNEAFFQERTAPVDPKMVRVRHSCLKRMSESPMHYLDSIRSPFEETLSMKLGSGAHAMLLGKPWTVFTGPVRRGKVWDAFEAGHAGAVILNQREADEARRMVESVHACPDAMALLKGLTFERTLEYRHELQGRACQATPDAFCSQRVVEFKTARSAEPGWFNRDGKRRHYHAQLAWYLDAVAYSGLGTPAEAFIIAVESKRPHPVTVMPLTDRAIDLGRRACRLWLERLIACEAFDRWPGYCESPVPFDVTDDEGDGFALNVDGEDVEL